MKIFEITNYLESIAPLELQEDYDNSGMITGEKNWKCSGVLVSLDCTEIIVDEAIEKSCNLIVAHHPIVFSGLKSIVGKNYVERTIIKAIKNNIAIYAIHTNLDNVKNGVNGAIAEKLDIIDTKILKAKKDFIKKLSFYCPLLDSQKIKEKLWEAGAGKIGNYSHCSFSSIGQGTFMGNDDSKPTFGKRNILHTEKEEKIEIIINSYLETRILDILFSEHPYENISFYSFSII